MVVPVVVEVEDAVELTVLRDVDILRVLQALTDRLPRVLLHLYVVELPAHTKKKVHVLVQCQGIRGGGGSIPALKHSRVKPH